MTLDIPALLELWTAPSPVDSEAVAQFRELYADPVQVNGASLSVTDLIRRARALSQALTDVHREVLEVCDSGRQVAVAFRLEGTHVGPLQTSAGVLAPSGRRLSLRVIDVLTIVDGRITAVTVVADELGALAAVDAAVLVGAQT